MPDLIKACQHTLRDQNQIALMSRADAPILIIFLYSALGALTVLCVLICPLFVEFVRRLTHALSGGTGETAIWGEPLVYIPLMAIHYFFPWGAIGALLGGLLGWVIVKRS